ncbi:glycosyltransferase family 2 protein [Rhabdochromatium marinum]|uniref:glycosyltransferase family 2 protein n=1 Tax=Rhabdochromatium marinum TaxID=48729 RepID=UPI001903C986|nr:glycosyltransferase family 2 protein [Rhabdochromatium marinum]MBK1648839.1 hypothetical protein [Rhabdochromatium marinum]
MPLQTAVLFLVFNRPDATAQVFAAIRKAKVPRLYVAADGPRSNRPDDAEKVAKVRKIVTAVDWSCEVKTLFRAENLGCKYAVSRGITWFFEQEEQGIILEDDCLPSQSFFWFCDQILERYKNEERIMSIAGTNIFESTLINKKTNESYLFSNYALMWGWATWRRAWNKYDLELSSWPSYKKNNLPTKKPRLTFIERLTWKRILDKTYDGIIDTWDYQWIYSCWTGGGLTILPGVNLVRNIGFSDDATHTKKSYPILSNLVEQEMSLSLRHPNQYRANQLADQFISRYWFGASWYNYFKSLFLLTPGLRQLNSLIKKLKAK